MQHDTSCTPKRVTPCSWIWQHTYHCLCLILATASFNAVTFAASSDDLGASKSGAPTAAYECREPCDRFKILWTGDTCLGCGTECFRRALSAPKGHQQNETDLNFTLARLRTLVSAADYMVGNLEGPITTLRSWIGPAMGIAKNWSYNMIPETARVLRGVGFSAVGLANNHAYDRGTAGLADTLQHLRKAGVATLGVAKGQPPLLIETPFGKVGVVAMWLPGPKQNILHLLDMDPPLLTKNAVSRGAKKARRLGAKWIVGFAHWGGNYHSQIQSRQLQAAEWFAEAGYDLVIGHGPHIAQPVMRVGKTTILFSIGNFAFSTAGRYKQKDSEGRGLVARTYLGPNGFEGIEMTCLLVDNAIVTFQARACEPQQQERLFGALGPDVRFKNGLGRIDLSVSPAMNASFCGTKCKRERKQMTTLNTKKKQKRRTKRISEAQALQRRQRRTAASLRERPP